MSWNCICLDKTLYYGAYCQFQTSTLKIKQVLSRSLASVAITIIVLTCSFIFSMDVLKYVFHVDPVKIQLIKWRLQKEADAPKVAIRFQYIP
jgi:hypothetical protein